MIKTPKIQKAAPSRRSKSANERIADEITKKVGRAIKKLSTR